MADKCEMCGKEFGHGRKNRGHRHHLLPRWMGVDAGFIDLCTGCHTKVESRMRRFLAGYETTPVTHKEYLDEHWKEQMKVRHRNEKRRFLFIIEFPGGSYQVCCSAANPEYSNYAGIWGSLIFKPSKRWTPDREVSCYYLDVTKCLAQKKPLLTREEYEQRKGVTS